MEVAEFMARSAALEREWAALVVKRSWHQAWAYANGGACVVHALWGLFGFAECHRQAQVLVILLCVVSLCAQIAVWQRGHRARTRVLMRMEALNEEAKRALEQGGSPELST